MLALGDVARARAMCGVDPESSRLEWHRALEHYRRSESVLGSLDLCLFHKEHNQRLYPQIPWAIGRVFLAHGSQLEESAACFAQAWETSCGLNFHWAMEECAQLIGRFLQALGDLRSANLVRTISRPISVVR